MTNDTNLANTLLGVTSTSVDFTRLVGAPSNK